ncbi:MAG: hypothetical protein VZR53_08825 [Prevotella sp.]|nr:hypothetical protein [Prevotella sp.]
MNWFVDKILKVDFSEKQHILNNPHFWVGLLAMIAGFALVIIGRTM